MKLLKTYIAVIDRLNYGIGRVIMFGIFAMMAVLLWSTISKFSDQPSLWTLEVAQFAMIAYFFLGGPYAIQMGSHVRMDLFYDNWSLRRKAATDAIMVLCLIAYLLVLLWGGISSTAYSLGYWGTEPLSFFAGLVTGSEEVGTLERSRTIWRPYLWPIKTVMCVGIILMLLQALSELAKDILRLKGEETA
ncbi:TRAP transporter small permease subunit [Ruegeria sp. SCPT10]|uniref:TRAP transporter small permease subunit n=1 Tax=Ruegeria sp. SCP10 TaxID=3141377 RepID=UPI00147F61CA